jgi:hypothetical protein
MEQSSAPLIPSHSENPKVFLPPSENPPQQQHQTHFPPKKFLILALVLLLLGGVIVFLNLSNKKSPPSSSPATKTQEVRKTWELVLSFDTEKNDLSVKNLTLLDKEINQDQRGSVDSNYRLTLMDKENKPLYYTKFILTKELIFNLLNNPSTSSATLTQPTVVNTTIYIPFFAEAKFIQITEGDKGIMQIELDDTEKPKKSSFLFNLIPQAFAQANNTPGKLQAVFISDGYTNFNEFHSDVQKLIAVFNATEPFASTNPSIFDFQSVDNTESLGCTSSILDCLSNPKIPQVGYSKFPNASKFIVIANDPTGRALSTSAVGAANGLGGNVGVFTNFRGLGDHVIDDVATHEFLGHMVGRLHDRYVLRNPAPYLLNFPNRSNCTDNPNGEELWKNAGVSKGSSSCVAQNFFAPYPTTCNSSNDKLLSGGSPVTVMSAVGCGGSAFDPVEQNWMKTQIIPAYQTAANTQATPAPTTNTANSTPAPTGAGSAAGVDNPGIGNIAGIVWNDTNRNKVKDSNEVGVANVEVGIYPDYPNKTFKSVKTDSSGKYLISNVGPREFVIQINKPNDYEWTTQPVTYANSSGYGANTNIVNFGIAPLVQINGSIFVDTNKNGVKDSGEQSFATPIPLCFEWLNGIVNGNIQSTDHCSGKTTNTSLGKRLEPVTGQGDWGIPSATDSQGNYTLKGYSGEYLIVLKEIPLGYTVTTNQQKFNTASGNAISFGIALAGSGSNLGSPAPSTSSNPNNSSQPSPSAKTSGTYVCEEVTDPQASAGSQIQLKRLHCYYK